MFADTKHSSVQEVPASDGEALASEFNVPFIETSAKENINVEKAFLTLTRIVTKRLTDQNAHNIASG